MFSNAGSCHCSQFSCCNCFPPPPLRLCVRATLLVALRSATAQASCLASSTLICTFRLREHPHLSHCLHGCQKNPLLHLHSLVAACSLATSSTLTCHLPRQQRQSRTHARIPGCSYPPAAARIPAFTDAVTSTPQHSTGRSAAPHEFPTLPHDHSKHQVHVAARLRRSRSCVLHYSAPPARNLQLHVATPSRCMRPFHNHRNLARVAALALQGPAVTCPLTRSACTHHHARCTQVRRSVRATSCWHHVSSRHLPRCSHPLTHSSLLR